MDGRWKIEDGRLNKVIGHWSLVIGKMISRKFFMRNSSLLTPHSSLKLSFLISSVASLVLISGCGYRPASQYARHILPDPVYVDVRLSGVEPQNGVYLKEEIMKVLRTHFQERVVSDKGRSVSQITVPNYTISYSPLTYDTDGYVTRYRVTANIVFILKTPKETLHKKISAAEDVSIQPGSLTSTAAREYAIRVAIRKAMDNFIAWVAQKGYGK